jgi:formylglycine-generating enzyme required for sulfatase activity
VKLALASLLTIVASFLGVVVAAQIEIRVDTLATRPGEPVEPCEVVEVLSADSPRAFEAWSTLFATSAVQCGTGAHPGIPVAPSDPTLAPSLIHEVAAVVGWEAGTMDPGPVGAFQVSLTVISKQLTGFSKEGKPLYSAPLTNRRVARLEPGEEFLLPGAQDVVLRFRVGWSAREGATEYGSVSIIDAAPGSAIVLDGGVAGRAGADGSLILANVPVGQREVRIRASAGSVVVRTVSVVSGRTLLIAPGTLANGSPPQPTLTPTGKNTEGYQEFRRVRDGAILVQIPEGEFLMGNLETEGAPLPHTVSVSPFLIDKLPLTVARFKRFAIATGRPLPPDPYWGVHDDFPVAFVRWDEARAYCEWAGGRLPTEAEREKAARGTDGRMFPWGSEPPRPEFAVFRRNWGQQGNDAVGVRPAGASPFGLLDAGGNMWEFCEDWWDPTYFKSSPKNDPAGPKTGRARLVKGGSWDSRPTVLSASSRNFAYIGYREGDFGFRCASEPPR